VALWLTGKHDVRELVVKCCATSG